MSPNKKITTGNNENNLMYVNIENKINKIPIKLLTNDE